MQTDFGALSTARKRVWANEITIAGRDANFWMSNGFMGRDTADMSKPVQKITELTKTERGTSCVMQLVSEIDNDGVVGDNTLTGNEAYLYNDAITINIDQLRNGLKSRGKMSEQATVIRFRSTGKEKLGFWLGDKIDELMFLTASGRAYTLNTDGSTRAAGSQLPNLTFAADVAAASSNRVLYAGTATSEGTLTTSDKVTWNLIVRAIAYGKRKRIKPVKYQGTDNYVFVLSTEQMRDLKTDPTYQTIVSRAAKVGDNNPLFRNAIVMIDGAILYDHQKVFNTQGLASGSKWGAGGTVDGAQGLMLGAQSMGFASIGEAEYNEADITDYGNQPGMAYGRIIGMLKPQYLSRYDSNTRQDFGVVSIKTAASPTS